MLLGWDMLKKSGSDLIAIWESLANEDVQLECLGIDIANIHATFVGEEDTVTLALGSDADIIFCTRWVREERLDNEVGECASNGFDLMDRSQSVQVDIWGVTRALRVKRERPTIMGQTLIQGLTP